MRFLLISRGSVSPRRSPLAGQSRPGAGQPARHQPRRPGPHQCADVLRRCRTAVERAGITVPDVRWEVAYEFTVDSPEPDGGCRPTAPGLRTASRSRCVPCCHPDKQRPDYRPRNLSPPPAQPGSPCSRSYRGPLPPSRQRPTPRVQPRTGTVRACVDAVGRRPVGLAAGCRSGTAWVSLRVCDARGRAVRSMRFPKLRSGWVDQRSPAKRSFSGRAAPVASWTRTKVSMPINSLNRSCPILRKKMFSPWLACAASASNF